MRLPSGGEIFGYDQRPFADDSPPPNLITLEFINENTGWLAGRIGLFKTVDAGTTWQQIGPRIAILPNAPESQFALGMLTHILYLDFATESTGWAARYDGLIKTTDAGKTWIVVDNPLRFYQFSFTDDNNGWVLHTICLYIRPATVAELGLQRLKAGPLSRYPKTNAGQ